MKWFIQKIKKLLSKNYISIIFNVVFLIFIIYLILATSLNCLKFYNKYTSVKSTITNIEQYNYKESSKNYVGLKIEYSYFVNEKEYKYEYKGALTDKVHNIGDTQIIYFSPENPEQIVLNNFSLIKCVCINILLLLTLAFYFVVVRKKKNSISFIMFVICIFGDLYFLNSTVNIFESKINYEKTDAIVDRTYTYSIEKDCTMGTEDVSKKCLYQETGALYNYEVDNSFYQASQLNVSSKTKYGDKKTIYYSQKNPMYYTFNINKNILINCFCLLALTSLAILENPFSKPKRRKKINNKKGGI